MRIYFNAKWVVGQSFLGWIQNHSVFGYFSIFRHGRDHEVGINAKYAYGIWHLQEGVLEREKNIGKLNGKELDGLWYKSQ